MDNVFVAGTKPLELGGDTEKGFITYPANNSFLVVVKIVNYLQAKEVVVGECVWDSGSTKKQLFAHAKILGKKTTIGATKHKIKVDIGAYAIFVRDGSFNTNPLSIPIGYEQAEQENDKISFTCYFEPVIQQGVAAFFEGPAGVTKSTFSGNLICDVEIANPRTVNIERIISWQGLTTDVALGDRYVIGSTDSKTVVVSNDLVISGVINNVTGCAGTSDNTVTFALECLPGRIENGATITECWVVTAVGNLSASFIDCTPASGSGGFTCDTSVDVVKTIAGGGGTFDFTMTLNTGAPAEEICRWTGTNPQGAGGGAFAKVFYDTEFGEWTYEEDTASLFNIYVGSTDTTQPYGTYTVFDGGDVSDDPAGSTLTINVT